MLILIFTFLFLKTFYCNPINDSFTVKYDSFNLDRSGHSLTWTAYHSLGDIYSFLDYLENNYDFVSTDSIGKSSEGKKMRIAKVCKGGCGSKKAVWIDAGIHARFVCKKSF